MTVGKRCVVVLGGGHTADGLRLGARSRERVVRSARLFHEIGADSFVCSGAYSIALDTPPPQTEATLMAELAAAHGVPPAAIVLEERSLDTIGNIAVVGAEILPQLGAERVWLVTSGYHLPRVRYLVRRIWGARFTAAYRAARARLPLPKRLVTALRERVLLRKTRRLLRGIPDGDVDRFLEARPLARATRHSRSTLRSTR